ncbi:MAG: GtrA family protein [Patescibacteria group bacterium]|jgi:putative flippase GtrA
MFKVTWKYIYNSRYLLSKYASVGAISGILDFGTLFILTEFAGLHYLISATISFIIGGSTNYWLNKRWTFKSNGQHRKQLPIFFVLATLGLIINNNIMYISVEKLELHYLWAKFLAAAIVTFWNFFGNRYLTFRAK